MFKIVTKKQILEKNLLKCPFKQDWLNKLLYAHSGEYFVLINKVTVYIDMKWPRKYIVKKDKIQCSMNHMSPLMQ